MYERRSTAYGVGIAAHPLTMKVVVHGRYGEPDVLTVAVVGKPVPGDDEVLIRLIAARASIGDYHVVTGNPCLLRLSPSAGIPRPRHPVPGAAMSGRIEAVGARATNFRVGDQVFGPAPHGAFAEYLAMPVKLVAHKPTSLTFEESAAVPWGTTALQGIRDAGEVKAGERVQGCFHGHGGEPRTVSMQEGPERERPVYAMFPRERRLAISWRCDSSSSPARYGQ